MRLLPAKEFAIKWIKNTLTFFAPLFVLYLAQVQGGIMKDGFQTVDLIPNSQTTGAGILYIVNVLYDYFNKLKASVAI